MAKSGRASQGAGQNVRTLGGLGVIETGGYPPRTGSAEPVPGGGGSRTPPPTAYPGPENGPNDQNENFQYDPWVIWGLPNRSQMLFTCIFDPQKCQKCPFLEGFFGAFLRVSG